MTFKSYWEQKGARFCANNHEDRAKHAWHSANNLRITQLLKLSEMAGNLRQDYPSGSLSLAIAVDDFQAEITEMLKNDEID